MKMQNEIEPFELPCSFDDGPQRDTLRVCFTSEREVLLEILEGTYGLAPGQATIGVFVNDPDKLRKLIDYLEKLHGEMPDETDQVQA